MCFEKSLIPSVWRQGILHPIPKSGMKDIYTPTNYRGLMLICTLEKTYTSILSKRFNTFCIEHVLTSDKQAGFKPTFSCEEQIFNLYSVIKQNMNENKSTYCAFIDIRKFFDWVDRSLLLYKLAKNNVCGSFYSAVKCIYSTTNCTIRVNDMLSKSFNIESGLLQGETFSPSLAAFYLNDLIHLLKENSKGCSVKNSQLCILLYADDIVLMSDCEKDLQNQLCLFNNWCMDWQISCNLEKTKVVHFRNHQKRRTNTIFHLNGKPLETVSEYKYLGLFFDEFLTFNYAVSILSKSAHRALSGVISKIQNIKDLPIKVFTKLYESCVLPILSYGSSVWGHDKFYELENVTKRALRYYLGLPKRTPIPCLYLFSNWMDVHYHTIICKARLYNRLVSFNNSRLSKKVFVSDVLCGNNWYEVFIKACVYINFIPPDNLAEKINLEIFTEKCYEKCYNSYLDLACNMSKLNLFVNAKIAECKDLVNISLRKVKRSKLLLFLSDCLKLKIETGRYINLPISERLCFNCKDKIENQLHFVFECPVYALPRSILYNKCKIETPTKQENYIDIVHKLCSDNAKTFANYIYDAWNLRNNCLYKLM